MRNALRAGGLALLLAGCGGYDVVPPPGVGPAPMIGIGLSGAASITRGSTAELTVTVARSSTFNGPIDLSAEGLPAGVSASFAPATVPGGSTTSTLTLSATTTAALGTAIGAVRAKATGLTDAVAQLVIAVNP